MTMRSAKAEGEEGMSEPQDSIIVPSHGTYHSPMQGPEWYRWEDGGKIGFTVDQVIYTVEAQPATWHHLTVVDGHPYFDGKLVEQAKAEGGSDELPR